MANAAEFHARAAEHARERLAHDAVLDHVQRALALLDDKPGDGPAALRWRLLDVREANAGHAGSSAPSSAPTSTRWPGSPMRWTMTAGAPMRPGGAATSNPPANYHAEESAARQAMNLAERVGDTRCGCVPCSDWLYAHANLGDSATGKSLAQQGLSEARSRGLRQRGAVSQRPSVIANQQDDLVGFLELTQQTLSIYRVTGNLRLQAVTLGNLGVAWLNLGELERAQRELEEGLRLRRANGDRAAETGSLCNLSTLALWHGDAARAHAFARTALDIALAVEAHFWEALALVCLGNAELALGTMPRRSQACEQARARAMEIGHALQYDATAGLARVALASEDPNGALGQLEPVLAHLSGGGNLEGTDWPRLIELTCHQALSRAGDARVSGVLARIHGSLQARAATIDDAALRHSFLNNIPHHREIVSAWRARDAE